MFKIASNLLFIDPLDSGTFYFSRKKENSRAYIFPLPPRRILASYPGYICFSKHGLESFCTWSVYFACSMAVIGRCESGFLVDHKKSITESVSPLLLTCKETLFALYEPYFRSSTENSCEPNSTRKRKVTD